MATRAERFALAAELGHEHPTMFQTASGRRWFITCSCGWESTTRATELEALKSGVHHVLKAADTYLRETARAGGGVSLPGSVRAHL